jgi:acyl-coenzyme A synthetase/AMP-(fatty) acid ligase
LGHAAETKVTTPAAFDGGLTPIDDMVQIEVVDEADHALPAGSEGRVRIRGVLGTPSYVNERLSVEHTIRNGWFYPGDLGHFDAEGRLHISGRSNEVLNIGGVKFNALQLDDVVQSHKGVKDGYCYLRDNQFGSEVIEVVFVPEAGQDAAAVAQGLLAACARTLPVSLAPKQVFAVSDLPRTDTGKAMRRKAQEATSNLTPTAIAP